MNSRNFFTELKRRNVYKVAVAYAVVGWLVVQICSTVLPTFHAPEWVNQTLIVLVAVGFPIALVLAWAYEITPEGIKRESEVQPNESSTPKAGHKLVAVTVGLAVIAAGLFTFQLLSRKSATKVQPASTALVVTPEKSIAVLPFDNLSHDPDNAYFAEGVQDEILTRLAKVADLKVISRTSTQHFRSSPDNLPQIARQLGVAHILEGSVQKSNDQVRVNVQLINAMTDTHLWADIYDRKLTDLFTVESDIAKTIADTLQAKLTGSEKTAMASHPTENPEAYQLYLQGRFFWNKRTGPDLHRSIDYFQQAIAKDPNYALAYAASAQAWLLLPAYNGGAPMDCFPQAEVAAKKALSLDESCVEAHVAMGALRANSYFDLAGAVTELQRAIQLDPNSATAHHWLANQVLANMGQNERETSEMKRAQEIDPLSLIINTNLGVAYFHAGRFEEALAQLRKTVEMDGSFYFSRWNLGIALQMQGHLPEATAEYQKAVELSGDPVPLGSLGGIEALSGHKEEARKVLDQLVALRGQQYVTSYALALTYIGLGEKDEAVKWLTKGYEERDGFDLCAIRVDPLLFPLHGDPGFEALAEKIFPKREFAKAAALSQ